MVVLSNENTRTQLLKMKAIDPHAKFFRAVVTSESVGQEKPHKLMFQHALHLLGSSAETTMMVGDSFEDDIAPALTLGMPAALTTEFNRANQGVASQRSFRVLAKLDDLISVL